MNKTINYTAGFLSGAVVGSVVALLFAPENGRNIRDTLSYRLNNYLDDANHLISRLSYENGIGSSDAKKKSDEVVEDAQKRAESLINEVEELLDTIEKEKNSTENSEEDQE